MEDCKKRNILYESSCTLCNPEEEARKKARKSSELGSKTGLYVGEFARSIHERAKKHYGDMVTRKEDSHMVKHWRPGAE